MATNPGEESSTPSEKCQILTLVTPGIWNSDHKQLIDKVFARPRLWNPTSPSSFDARGQLVVLVSADESAAVEVATLHDADVHTVIHLKPERLCELNGVVLPIDIGEVHPRYLWGWAPDPNNPTVVFRQTKEGIYKVKITSDGEEKATLLLNAAVVLLDVRTKEDGGRSYLVVLVQGARRSHPFEVSSNDIGNVHELVGKIHDAVSRTGGFSPPCYVNASRELPQVVLGVAQESAKHIPPVSEREYAGIDEDEPTLVRYKNGAYVVGYGFIEGVKGRSTVTIGGKRRELLPSKNREHAPEMYLGEDAPSLDHVRELMVRTFGEDTAYLLLAFASSVFALVLRNRRDVPQSILNFVGPKGSGKTAVMTLMLGFFGTHEAVASLQSSTRNGVLALLTRLSGFPVGFDEYRRGISFDVLSLMRSAYDGGSVAKGTVQRGTTQDHPLRSSIVIAGEHSLDDGTGALQDRCVVISFESSAFLNDTQQEWKVELPKLTAVGQELMDKLMEFGDQAFEESYQEMRGWLSESCRADGVVISGRRIDIYACLLASLSGVMDVDDGVRVIFYSHVKQSTLSNEESSLDLEFLSVLHQHAAGLLDSEIETFLRLDGAALFVAHGIALRRYNKEVKNPVARADIRRHLKARSWCSTDDRTVVFKNPGANGGDATRRHKAWLFKLEHDGCPEVVKELAALVGWRLEGESGVPSEENAEIDCTAGDIPLEEPAWRGPDSGNHAYVRGSRGE